MKENPYQPPAPDPKAELHAKLRRRRLMYRLMGVGVAVLLLATFFGLKLLYEAIANSLFDH